MKLAEARRPEAVGARRSWQTFERCRRFIEDHYMGLRTMEQAAEGCHVAPAYLSRLFSRFLGQSPYQCLMRLRMNHAATLLTEQPLMVREATDAFDMDAFHFSRAFKKVHGVSPSAFARERV